MLTLARSLLLLLLSLVPLLLFATRGAGQWRFDGSAYTVNSNGDVLTFSCDGAVPYASVAIIGAATGPSMRVAVAFDGTGFWSDWESISSLGALLLIAPRGIAEEVLRRARPARRLEVRVGARRATFSLLGLTAASNRLSCIGPIRAAEEAARALRAREQARAEERRREEAAALAAQMEEELRRRAVRDSIARVEFARQDSIARIAALRQDSIARARRAVSDSIARVSRERQDSLLRYRITQDEQAARRKANKPAFWVGGDVSFGYVAEVFSAGLAVLAGAEWRALRLSLRPVDLIGLRTSEGKVEEFLLRYGGDLRLSVKWLSLGGGGLRYGDDPPWEFWEHRGKLVEWQRYAVLGGHSSTRVGLRSGVDLRLFEKGSLEILVSLYGAFR